MRRIVITVLAAMLVSVAPVLAADDVGIITGSDKGTYYQFGLDVQKLMKDSGINVTVHPSKGSIENIFAVYQRPGVQLRIVHSDAHADKRKQRRSSQHGSIRSFAARAASGAAAAPEPA